MNREDIIRIAIEAEFNLFVHDLTEKQYIEVIERFATLVAQLERERIAKKLEQLPFGDTAASFAIYVRES